MILEACPRCKGYFDKNTLTATNCFKCNITYYESIHCLDWCLNIDTKEYITWYLDKKICIHYNSNMLNQIKLPFLSFDISIEKLEKLFLLL